MRAVKLGILAAAAACLMGTSTAWACDVLGSVVCGGTGEPVANVQLTFTQGAVSYSAGPTDANGAFGFYLYEGSFGMWGVTLDLSGAGGPASFPIDPVEIAWPGEDVAFVLAPIVVDVPGCEPPPPPPPPSTADCSPGYYKNHPTAWCGPCGFSVDVCNSLLNDLRTGGSSGAREAAKAQIDACFGTAAASPCQDD